MIRARAGNRAYWVSTVIVYAGLMWVSFAASGSLPALSAMPCGTSSPRRSLCPLSSMPPAISYDQSTANHVI